jgi:hypothetical protein
MILFDIVSPVLQIIDNVEQGCTLRSESHWNTELLVHLSILEREKMRIDGVTEEVELMYMVEANGEMIVPVNIGEQEAENPVGRVRIALIKHLIHGGHVFLLKEMLDSNGSNILPEFLLSIKRWEWCTFFKDQIRVDTFEQSCVISVFDVKHFRSNDRINSISLWDALAFHVADLYTTESWETVARAQFLMVYNSVNHHQRSDSLKTFFEETCKNDTDIGVDVTNAEVFRFLATMFDCMLVIVNVATSGLGYIIQQAFVGEGVCIDTGTIYVLVHLQGQRYDALCSRCYEDDTDGSKEERHVLAISSVVLRYLQRNHSLKIPSS